MTKRKSIILLALLLAVALGLAHRPVLGAAGTFLSLSDAPQPVDVVVVAYAAGREGAQQAARLYQDGYAPLILVSNAKVTTPGIRVAGLADLYRIELGWLGVPESAVLPVDDKPTSTEEEAREIARALEARGARSAIVITSAHRMRRTLLSLRHTTQPAGSVALLASPVATDDFALDQWWTTRAGISALANEYPRLLYYYLRGRL